VPVWVDGGHWCDGGIVDIFPVRPSWKSNAQPGRAGHRRLPVPYGKVPGVGFNRQSLSTKDWPAIIQAGRDHARPALRALGNSKPEHRVAAGLGS
jgi:hypothetical protein